MDTRKSLAQIRFLCLLPHITHKLINRQCIDYILVSMSPISSSAIISISWEVNTTSQSTYDATGLNLTPGQTVNLNLGDYNFSTEGTYDITTNLTIANDFDSSNNQLATSYDISSIVGGEEHGPERTMTNAVVHGVAFRPLPQDYTFSLERQCKTGDQREARREASRVHWVDRSRSEWWRWWGYCCRRSWSRQCPNHELGAAFSRTWSSLMRNKKSSSCHQSVSCGMPT